MKTLQGGDSLQRIFPTSLHKGQMGFPHYFCSLNFSTTGRFPLLFQDCAMIYPIIWF